MKEIDLKDNTLTIMKDDRMLLGCCAIFHEDGDIRYIGPISDSPVPEIGDVVFLHPKDYASLAKNQRKHLN